MKTTKVSTRVAVPAAPSDGGAEAPAGFRAGFVALVGPPNAGKSTLLNHLLGVKIAAVAPRPQTTRNRILGVKNVPGAQIVLIDTPGLHRPTGRGRTPLNRYMLEEAHAAITDVDLLVLMVEAPSPALVDKAVKLGGMPRIPDELSQLIQKAKEAKKPAVLVINKIDTLKPKELLLPVLDAWAKVYDFAAVVPISALKGRGTEQLVAALVPLLPEGKALFPEEMITDRAERWLAAELVREQVFLLTKQEIPYAVAITIDTFEERVPREAKGKAPPPPAERADASSHDEVDEADAGPDPDRTDVVIEAVIHVEKEAQKRIVVGEAGRMVKEIGTRARAQIAQLLGCPVHLRLFVRVDEGWSESEAQIRELGYE